MEEVGHSILSSNTKNDIVTSLLQKYAMTIMPTNYTTFSSGYHYFLRFFSSFPVLYTFFSVDNIIFQDYIKAYVGSWPLIVICVKYRMYSNKRNGTHFNDRMRGRRYSIT